jgi:hypothetical protein
MRALKNVGAALTEASVQRQDVVPFAKTINALNRVSRTLQDERRKEKTMSETRNSTSGATQGLALPTTVFDTFQNLVASELPDFDASLFSTLPDYNMNIDGDFQSLGFVRALEDDFVARNWHGDWWNLNDEVNEGISSALASEP